MKNHLKRIASPKTWTINRKERKFVTRPKPGAHAFENGLPLGIVVRDVLRSSSTMAETKKILNNHEILVDGKRRKDHRFIVGLFDVLKIVRLNKHYRVIFNKKGNVIVSEIKEAESEIKPCQIVGKTALTKKQIQFNLHDGKNIVADIKANVGDTLILSLPKLEVKGVLPLQPGAIVFLTKGKHSGNLGTFKAIKNEEAIYTKGGEEIETAKEYLFVIGKKKPVIEVDN